MDQPSYIKIAQLAETAEAIEKSISYMQENLKRFLKKNEKVLLLFPKVFNCGFLSLGILRHFQDHLISVAIHRHRSPF